MKKLFHVVRGVPDRGTPISFFNQDGEPWRFRSGRNPEVLHPRELDVDRTNYQKEGEFFLVSETDVDDALRILATANPGCEVRVYNIEQIAQCPAAEMVVKKVSEHGILPS